MTAPLPSDREPRAFFERYASISLSADPRALAQLYAPSFIVAGPQGSASFANDARFLDWLTQVAASNREHGMRALEVVEVDELALSPIHALAKVTWGARFDATGERLVEFEIAYLLEKASAGTKVLAYISRADQDEEMKRLGLG